MAALKVRRVERDTRARKLAIRCIFVAPENSRRIAGCRRGAQPSICSCEYADDLVGTAALHATYRTEGDRKQLRLNW